MLNKYISMTKFELRKKYDAHRELKEFAAKHKKCCDIELPNYK